MSAALIFLVLFVLLIYPQELLCADSAVSIDCSEGHFRCNNSTVTGEHHHCLPQINICDGTPDCPNGSDEENCDDKQFDNHIDELFRKKPSAEHDDLDPTCVLSYNGSCFCRHEDIYCHHKGFDQIPDDLPDSIDILDFTGNNFKVLTESTFDKILCVFTLVLQHCEIEEVQPFTFYNLTSMITLHIDNNHIQEIPKDLFGDYNNLKTLIIRYNDISVIRPNAFKDLTELTELDLSYNRLTVVTKHEFAPLRKLQNLNLEGNFLRYWEVNSLPHLPITTLSLGNNSMEIIEPNAFRKLTELQHLFLSKNKLSHLRNGSFATLQNLQTLTLDNNLLENIDNGVFLQCTNLDSLDLRSNIFRRLDKSVLRPLQNLSHIYFEKFEMCFDAPHVRICEPKGDGISSQEHLLDNTVLRTSVWIMATIGCLGNIIVLLGRCCLNPTYNVVHSLYIRNLAISDLLMGIYLFTLAGVDMKYRGVYLQHQWRWRHSALCNICGFLNTLSCESSVLILSLVTWDRYVSITQPLGRKQPSAKAAILTLLLLWTIAVLIAFIPISHLLVNYFGYEFYNSNGVCLPLYIHNPFAKGWLYSVVMFMCLNALALVFICYAYCRMIREIRISAVACRSTQHSLERDKVAQRFGVIVLTDCICWVPVIVIKIVALSGIHPSEDYQRFLYAFLAIYILPINCALNPVLYTITTKLFKKQIRRIFHTCLYRKQVRRDPQNSGYDSAFSLSLGVFQKGGSMRRVLTYRATQSSVTTSKNSWKRSVV